MKYLILLLTVFLLGACNQKSPVSININEWNYCTYNAITCNFELDTACYLDSTKPQLVINGNEINSFKEHLFYFLRKREAFVSYLMRDSIFNTASEIYIKEFIGEGNCQAGNYIVLAGTKSHAREFTHALGIDSDSDDFNIEEFIPFDLENFNHFYCEFTECTINRIKIATVFRSTDSITSCEIIGVEME